YPRILFTKMTCWITAYASLERCYCIVAPLHVKTMITPRRTFIALAGLYAVGINTSFPLFYTGTVFLEWKTDLLSNRTVLGMGINSHYADVANVTTVLVAVLFFLFFTISVVTTIILTVALHEKSKWRNSLGNCTDKSSKSLAKRDTTIIKTIVLLSLVLIVSYLPYMINCLLVAFLKGFELYGKYYNLYQIMWSVSWLFETMNSSTSLFVYYITSSKFRETFWQIFAKMYSIPGKQQKL
ncbi:G-protein coupled receptor, partial [Biomphalaria pfeifferi]